MSTLSNLGEVTHAFIDKTGTLTSNEYSVGGIYMKGKLYVLNAEKYN